MLLHPKCAYRVYANERRLAWATRRIAGDVVRPIRWSSVTRNFAAATVDGVTTNFPSRTDTPRLFLAICVLLSVKVIILHDHVLVQL